MRGDKPRTSTHVPDASPPVFLLPSDRQVEMERANEPSHLVLMFREEVSQLVWRREVTWPEWTRDRSRAAPWWGGGGRMGTACRACLCVAETLQSLAGP